jgi:predicted TIM-barrel fold metal-dependent hydrolase
MNGVSTPWYGLFDAVITPKIIMQKFFERGFANWLLWNTDVQALYNSDFEKNKMRGHIKDNHVLKLLEELEVSEEDKANIHGNNAARLFKL